MTNIVHEILCEQDLSRAGQLFNVNSKVLLDKFPETIDLIRATIDSKHYAQNVNEQSIIEIVLTRCLSALRDTHLITQYYDDLLDLIEICLKYNLSYANDHCNENDLTFVSANTPHANIVSDIFSCILMDYLDVRLSERSIPICIRLLKHSNKELSREICSYLNLIACRDASLLLEYVNYIVDIILRDKINSSLCRMLLQLCQTDIECIYPLTKHLIKAIKIVDYNDLSHLLKIFYFISLNHVQLVIVHLDDIIEFLVDDNLQDLVLDILYSIANQQPIALDTYLPLFEKSAYFNSYKIYKIISTIGKSLKGKSEYCCNLLAQRLDNTDNSIIILKEIFSIAQVHSGVLDTCMLKIYEHFKNTSSSNVRHMIDQLNRLRSTSSLNLQANSCDSIEQKNKYIQSRSHTDVIDNNNDYDDDSQSINKFLSTHSCVRESPSKSDDFLNSTLIEVSKSGTQSNSLDFRFDKSLTIREEDENEEKEQVEAKIESQSSDTEENERLIEEIISSIDRCIDEDEKKDQIKEIENLREQEISPISTIGTRFSTLTRCSDYLSLERDVVRQFCDKHMNKIGSFVHSIFSQIPLPVECSLDEQIHSKTLKYRPKYLNLNFTCYLKGQYCLFDKNYFEIRTANPSIWIHLMFLSLQSKWSYPLTQRDQFVIDLKTCYQAFKHCDKLGFVSLVTSSFPNEKQQRQVLNELKDLRFFDLFQFNNENKQWFCYLCSNPDRARELTNHSTLIQGQLKEKRGKWKIFKRWKKRLYSLTGGNIVFIKKDMRQESLSVRHIKNIRPSKTTRSIPKAFEIFTDRNSFILKANSSKDAEQWIQFLHLSKAHEISRFNINESTVYNTSL